MVDTGAGVSCGGADAVGTLRRATREGTGGGFGGGGAASMGSGGCGRSGGDGSGGAAVCTTIRGGSCSRACWATTTASARASAAAIHVDAGAGARRASVCLACGSGGVTGAVGGLGSVAASAAAGTCDVVGGLGAVAASVAAGRLDVAGRLGAMLAASPGTVAADGAAVGATSFGCSSQFAGETGRRGDGEIQRNWRKIREISLLSLPASPPPCESLSSLPCSHCMYTFC